MPGTTFRTAPVRARETAVLKDSILAKLTYACGKDRTDAQPRDWFVATAHALRDRVFDRWIAGERAPAAPGKRVYLLSVEYLIGRLLGDALCNLAITVPVREALAGLGVDLDQLRAVEPDAALGNGGLGRLAACFMDSLASLGIAACGYGIRYEHGLF